VETHLTRLARTLELTPHGAEEDRVLEMGAYMQITPALHFELGYGEVRGCYYGKLGDKDSKTVVAEDGREFRCEIDHFDAEKDAFPYPGSHFSTVLCCELIEHLPSDPMHTMSEINRILRDEGHLVLTTPNIASARSIAAVFAGYHPALFPAYLKPEAVAQGESRHHREYTAKEIHLLLHYAGFDVLRLETGPFRDRPHPELAWVDQLIERYGFPKDLRGEGIYAVGRKTGPVRDRYPNWLYS
jgi:SAM-dependent methyltransferase